MAIYSALHIDTVGINGTQLRPRQADSETLVCIGCIGERYFYVGQAHTEQHPEIKLKTETLTDEIEQLIKKSQLASANKSALRAKIAEDVGDIHDLIADQAKTLEFLFVLVARMADEFLGGTAIPADRKAEYLARVQAVTGALDASAITLRGDYTQPDKMLQDVLGKTDLINKLVKSDYVDSLNALVQS